MSPEAWAFFSANTLALIALLGKAIDSYVKNKKAETRQELIIEQTKSVSNGTVPKLAEDVAFIRQVVVSLDQRVGRLEDAVR